MPSILRLPKSFLNPFASLPTPDLAIPPTLEATPFFFCTGGSQALGGGLPGMLFRFSFWNGPFGEGGDFFQSSGFPKLRNS